MGFFKKLGKTVSKALPYVGAAAGAYFGGPAGAQAGFAAGNTTKSLVSGNSRDFSNTIKSNIASAVNGTGYEWLAGAIGAGGSSADSIQSIATDADLNYWNLERQKELAKYNADQQLRLNNEAFNKNLDMWNLQNAYNSPEAQMKRFEAAGLNKNLIYDQSNTAGSGPTFEAPKFDTGPYNPVDTRVQRAQLALALQEHKLQIENQAIENDMKRQQLVLSARASDREDKLADAQIKNLASTLGIRSAELGIRGDEFAQRIQETKDQNAWRRYQNDLDYWQKRYDDIQKNALFPHGYYAKKKQKEYLKTHRKPMYMDYI